MTVPTPEPTEPTEPTEPSVEGLASTALPTDTVGLLEGLTSTRAIRRYRDEPVPEEVLRAILFSATRAPSGSNRQPFRFVVLRNGPRARAVKALIGRGARDIWAMKRVSDGYDRGSATVSDSPTGARSPSTRSPASEMSSATA